MAVISSVSLKAYFETGDKPTQSQFEDFIDSVYPPHLEAFTQRVVSAGNFGIPEVLSAAAVTVHPVGAFTRLWLNTPTTAAAQAKLNVVPGTDVQPFSTALRQGRHTQPVPGTALFGRTTNGAGSYSREAPTNKNMMKGLAFDSATDEYGQYHTPIIKSYSGDSLNARLVWTHATAATNFGVVWSIAALGVPTSGIGDAAFGTAVTAVCTGGPTDGIFRSAMVSGIVPAGSPAGLDFMQFQVRRHTGDAGDTLAVDAGLIGLYIDWPISAATDA